MKKLTIYIYIITVVASLVIIDVAVGYFFNRYTQTHSLKGDYDNLRHVLYECDDDVVVFGSSVALNSINTKVLEDSIGLRSFNAASNGQTLFYHLVVMKSMLQRHAPKMILLGINSDDFSTDDRGERFKFLTPYYNMGFDEIDKSFEQDATEKVLMKSNLYRYNTIWWRILLYQFITPGEVGEQGFIAKPIPPSFPTLKTVEFDTTHVTERRRAELTEFISICKARGITLIFFNPPNFLNKIDYEHFNIHKELVEIAENLGIIYFDDTQHPLFLSHPEYFYDNEHLNKDGAAVYTSLMINRLKHLDIVRKNE
jgi:hypothetical protein